MKKLLAIIGLLTIFCVQEARIVSATSAIDNALERQYGIGI